MQSMPNYQFSIVMKPQAQHFNISEIYLHPSHTKRKHASNQNVQNQMSPIEDKDIALLKISPAKSHKSHPNRMRSTEIQFMPNRRRMKQIINRGGKIATYLPTDKKVSGSSSDFNRYVQPIDCDLNNTKGVIKFDINCKNETTKNSTSKSNESNSRILEGFPLMLLYPKSRSRQSLAVIGYMTEKVKIIYLIVLEIILI